MFTRRLPSLRSACRLTAAGTGALRPDEDLQGINVQDSFPEHTTVPSRWVTTFGPAKSGCPGGIDVRLELVRMKAPRSRGL